MVKFSLSDFVIIDEQVQHGWDKCAEAWCWYAWQRECCVESGGHFWYMELDDLDGFCIYCRRCPVDIDVEFTPDAVCSLYSDDIILQDGRTVRLDAGTLIQYPDPRNPVEEPYCWEGMVELRGVAVTHPGGPWGPTEYDYYIDVEVPYDRGARSGA